MDPIRAVRKQFDISAPSEPQLELRLHWFGRALDVRRGYILDVKRRRSRAGKHVASIAYELPLPEYPRGPRRPRGGVRETPGRSQES